MKLLHILNGDATLELFKQTEIQGDLFVWREILCEGPTHPQVGSEAFWQLRTAFLSTRYPEQAKKYLTAFRQQLRSIDLGSYDEIVLWFEHDLFCQINFLGVIAWLNHNSHPNQSYSWVRIDKLTNYQDLIGLGEIAPEDYPKLLENRQPLKRSEIHQIGELWQIYSSGQHELLVEKSQALAPEHFPYLTASLVKHSRRFPKAENGLNELEELALKTIAAHKLTDRQLVGQLLRQDRLYGFGDLQFFDLIHQLQDLFNSSQGPLQLNQRGQDVLEEKAVYVQPATERIHYGGARREDFYWSEAQQGLVRRA